MSAEVLFMTRQPEGQPKRQIEFLSRSNVTRCLENLAGVFGTSTEADTRRLVSRFEERLQAEGYALDAFPTTDTLVNAITLSLAGWGEAVLGEQVSMVALRNIFLRSPLDAADILLAPSLGINEANALKAALKTTRFSPFPPEGRRGMPVQDLSPIRFRLFAPAMQTGDQSAG